MPKEPNQWTVKTDNPAAVIFDLDARIGEAFSFTSTSKGTFLMTSEDESVLPDEAVAVLAEHGAVVTSSPLRTEMANATGFRVVADDPEHSVGRFTDEGYVASFVDDVAGDPDHGAEGAHCQL